ncbi:MAG: DUF1554 domain-containing protein [Burkholderiales bacterium]|nr:DUF1554 domain-containing protein [Burkholderiales bacterium]
MKNTKLQGGILAILAAISLASCGGSGSSANGGSSVTPSSNNDLSQVSISSLTEYPAHTKGTAFIALRNNGDKNVSGLNYNLINANSKIAIESASAANCASIAAKQSCNLRVVFNDTATVSGELSVSIKQNLSTSSNKFGSKLWRGNLSQKITEKEASIGLVNVPSKNTLSGADSAYLLLPTSVAAARNGVTPVIVNVVVNSTNIGVVNTFDLVDTSSKHNKLSYASVLSGNNGGANFSNGQVVSFLLNIPTGTKQLSFQLQASGKGGSNVSYSKNATTINLVDKSAAVMMLPSIFAMDETFESQQLYIANTGTRAANNLSLPSVTTADGVVINVSKGISKPCSGSLDAGAYCSYSVSFNSKQAGPSGGVAGLNLSYKDGTVAAIAHASIEYSGTKPTPPVPTHGLSVNSDTYTFETTTSSPTQYSVVTIVNTGNGYKDSNVVFDLPVYFSIAASKATNACIVNGNIVTNTLASGESCSLDLVYSNTTKTLPTHANLGVSYVYSTGSSSAKDSLAPIDLTYSTEQSPAAVLSFVDASVLFDRIVNNNTEYKQKNIRIINNGGGDANNLNFALNDSSIFGIKGDSCNGVLKSGKSCGVTVQFGPSQTSNDFSTVLTASYHTEGTSDEEHTSVDVSGSVVATKQANLIVNLVSAPTSTSGDGKTVGSPFKLKSGTQNSLLVLRYKNIGADAAAHLKFNTEQIQGGYKFNSSTCQDSLVPNASCEISLEVPTANTGVNNLLLAQNLQASWDDQTGQYTDKEVDWVDSDSTVHSQVFVSVYEAAGVKISTNPRDLSNVVPGEGFAITAQLSVGDEQESGTLSIINLSELTQGNITSNTSSCDLNIDKPNCTINIGTNLMLTPSGDHDIKFSSSMTISPDATVKFTTVRKKMFVTESSFSGFELNSPMNADKLCNSDSNKPNGGGLYKALIGSSDPARYACNHLNACSVSEAKDWVLQANTLYVKADGETPIARSQESQTFAFPLSNAIAISTDPSTFAWTGLLSTFAVNAQLTCENWKTNYYGSTGVIKNVDTKAIGTNDENSDPVFCSDQYPIYCVEQ